MRHPKSLILPVLFILVTAFLAGCGGRFVNPGAKDASLAHGIAVPSTQAPAKDAKK